MPAVPQVMCWDHNRRCRHTDVTWTLRKGRQGDTLVIASASSPGSAAPAVTTGVPPRLGCPWRSVPARPRPPLHEPSDVFISITGKSKGAARPARR